MSSLITGSFLEALCEDAADDENAEVYNDTNLKRERLDRASAWVSETSAMADNTIIDESEATRAKMTM